MHINEETPASANWHGASGIVQLGGERTEGKPTAPVPQPAALSRTEALRRAREYDRAARRNAAFGRDLGGRHGAVLVDLASHFARRAVAFRFAAGGLEQ